MLAPVTKKYDVEGLKSLVVSICDAAAVVDAVLADGKVDFKDLTKLPALLSVGKNLAAVQWKDIPEQASDVDTAEATELAELFKTKFNLQNDSVEATLEQGFFVIMQVVAGWSQVKDVVEKIMGKKPTLPSVA